MLASRSGNPLSRGVGTPGPPAGSRPSGPGPSPACPRSAPRWRSRGEGEVDRAGHDVVQHPAGAAVRHVLPVGPSLPRANGAPLTCPMLPRPAGPWRTSPGRVRARMMASNTEFGAAPARFAESRDPCMLRPWAGLATRLPSNGSPMHIRVAEGRASIVSGLDAGMVVRPGAPVRRYVRRGDVVRNASSGRQRGSARGPPSPNLRLLEPRP